MQFQQEPKMILPYFKKARKENKKSQWRAENGHCTLYVDGIKVKLS